MSGTASVEFDASYQPLIGGGSVGQVGAEIYPLRCEVHGTHQLSHWYDANCTGSSEHTHMFHEDALTKQNSVRNANLSSGGVHSFHCVVGVSIDKQRRMFEPYSDAGAYTEPLTVGQHRVDNRTGDLICSASTCVIVFFYATTFTEYGQQCWSHTGTALIALETLMKLQNDPTLANFRVEVVQNRDNNSSVPQNNPLLKGYLFLNNVRVSRLALAPVTEHDVDIDKETIERTANIQNNIINRGMSTFFGPHRVAFLARTTKPFLRPFHCPEFRTERMPLPASAYAYLEPSGALNLAYYENCLHIALCRSSLTQERALQLARRALSWQRSTQSERYAFGSLCTRSATVFANSQCYLSDFHNRRKSSGRVSRAQKNEKLEFNEDFKVCRQCGGDDCEGVALEAYMFINQLCRAPSSTVERMSPLLRAVRTFLSQFVPVLTLGAVTNKKLTAKQLDQSAVLAHTYAMLVPYWRFVQMCDSQTQQQILQSKFARQRSVVLAESRDTILPIFIAEGTAPIDPAMQPVSNYYQQQQQNTDRTQQSDLHKALAAIETRRRVVDRVVHACAEHGVGTVNVEMCGAPNSANNEQDYSPFYKYAVAMTTSAFGDTRQSDFALVYNRDDDNLRSVGVDMPSLLDTANTSKTLAQLIPYLELSESESQSIDAVLLDQQPIPVLRLSSESETTQHITDQTRKLLQTLRDKGVELISPQLIERMQTRTDDTDVHRRFCFATTRQQDVTQNVVDALTEIVQLDEVKKAAIGLHTINDAVDGTDMHNTIVDIYLWF